MIDHLLRAAGTRRVLELAAGLSRRGAAFTSDATFDYTEIDLPRVSARKRELLERTDEGRGVLARTNLHLVEGDLETLSLEPFVVRGEPVFVIAEGLLMYLTADARRKLFAKVRELAELSGELRFVFDLVPTSEEPPPGAVGRVLEAAMKRFTGGRTFERDAKTREDVIGELRAAGFGEIEALGSTAVARAWDLPHADQSTTMVVFASGASSRATRS
jgi:O-methyltransferase involved in polyketide biosynthesis